MPTNVYSQHEYFSYVPQERKYNTQMSSVCCPLHQLLQLSHSNAFRSSPPDLLSRSAKQDEKMARYLFLGRMSSRKKTKTMKLFALRYIFSDWAKRNKGEIFIYVSYTDGILKAYQLIQQINFLSAK